MFRPILVLSFSIAWWVPLVIFLSAAPSIWVQLRYEDKAWSVEQAQAGTVRQMSIQERMLTGPEYAKEIWQFRLQSFLLHRWNTLFRSAFDEMRQVRKQGTTAVLGWSKELTLFLWHCAAPKAQHSATYSDGRSA